MADMQVKCGTCKQKYAVPEGTTIMAMKCLKCGSSISLSSATATGVKKRKREEPITLAVAPNPETGVEREVIVDAPGVQEVMGKHRRRLKGETAAWAGVAAMLCIAGGMIFFQLNFDAWNKYAPFYVTARNVVLALGALLLVVDAWENGMAKGVLALVFPPYLAVYAFNEAESRVVRGVFFGILLALVTEVFLLPDRSLVMGLGPTLYAMVEHVDSWINLAAREPMQ